MSSLLSTTVLSDYCDENVWYKGTVMGCKQIDGIGKYKIIFSDGNSTYAASKKSISHSMVNEQEHADTHRTIPILLPGEACAYTPGIISSQEERVC